MKRETIAACLGYSKTKQKTAVPENTATLSRTTIRGRKSAFPETEVEPIAAFVLCRKHGGNNRGPTA